MLSELLDLFAYSRWAYGRTLDAVGRLTPEQLARELGGSFPSVHATLSHLLSAEWVWLARWRGDPAPAAPALGAIPDAATFRARWNDLEDAQRGFLAGLTEDDVQRPFVMKTRSGLVAELPLGQTMFHLVNHGTYHRGQITNFLRQLGAEPAATDLVKYYAEQAKRTAAAETRAAAAAS